MFRSGILLAAAIATFPAAAQETHVSSSDNYEYYVLEDSIRPVREYGDQFVVAWEKQTRKNGSYRMVLTRYWCSEMKSNSVKLVEYDAAGKVLETFDFNSKKSKAFASDMVPNSVGNTMLRFVCARAP